MTGRDPYFATLQLAMAAAIAVSMFTLGGCQERQYNRYLHARDTITLSAGDAVAHNRAIHTIDPWPAYARKTEHTTNGKRIYLGMTRYQENKSLEPEGLSTSTTFENSDGAPPAAPPSGGGGGSAQ
ncbi:MAG: hypothetical protein IIB62_01270 [Proteobacteria bacterium]|nr:hypothetical protein [Pseudomonadota bacterium]